MDTTDLKTNMNAETSAIPPATGTSTINVGTAERIVSALGGAALTAMALRNLRSPSGISMLRLSAHQGHNRILRRQPRRRKKYCAQARLAGRGENYRIIK